MSDREFIKEELKQITLQEFMEFFLNMESDITDCIVLEREYECPSDLGMPTKKACQVDCRTCWIESFKLLTNNKTKSIRKNNRLIVLIGESASGKSTIEKMLSDSGKFKKSISDTTRPIRIGEIEGKDYNYLTEKEFENKLNKGEYIEHSTYNGWQYGVAKSEIVDSDKPVVLVINPHGFRQVNKLSSELDITSFYIKSSWQTRLKRIVDRGDDLMEIFRRLTSDMGVFQGIEDEVDYIIENDFYGTTNDIDNLNLVIQEILNKLLK